MKRIYRMIRRFRVYHSLLCVAVCAATVSYAAAPKRPVVALVLSGGGARGLSQIGVLSCLDSAGIEPDIIVASSIGAIVGGMYAAGYPIDSLRAFTDRVQWEKFFSNRIPRRHLFMNQKLENTHYLFELTFHENFTPVIPKSISHGQYFYDFLTPRLLPAQLRAGGNFDSLAVALRLVCTDLVTGKQVVLQRGNLATAIKASSSVPLAFSPVVMDSLLLVDGGLTSNIPCNVARDMQADIVIAVDATSPMYSRDDLSTPLQIALQIANINIEARNVGDRAQADLVISPSLASFSNMDFDSAGTIIGKGYTAACGSIAHIRALIDSARAGHRAPSVATMPSATENGGHAVHDTMPAASATHGAFNSGIDTYYYDSLARSFTVRRAGTDTLRGHRPGISPHRLCRHIRRHRRTTRIPYARLTCRRCGDTCTEVQSSPAVIRRIRITGNTHTASGFIRDLLGLQTGDTLDKNGITNALSSLYATDVFHTVNVSFDTTCVLSIRVTEKPRLGVQMSTRFDRFYLLEAYAKPYMHNVFGRAYSISALLQYGLRRERYALQLDASPLLVRRFGATIHAESFVGRERIVQREYRDTSDVYSLGEGFIHNAGIHLTLGTHLGKSMMVQTGIRAANYRVYQTDKSVIEERSFPNKLRYLNASLYVDDLNRSPFPLTGRRYYVTISRSISFQEPFAYLGGEKDFTTIEGELRQYFSLAGAHTIIPRLSVFWGTDSLPAPDKFYLGGYFNEKKYHERGVYNYISFIGLPPRELSGSALIKSELKYRLKLRRNTYAFFQTNVCHLSPSYKWNRTFFSTVIAGTGAGLEYASLIGPLRCAWGKTVYTHTGRQYSIEKPHSLYFSAGYTF